MAKKKVAKTRRETTRRQRSHWKKQQRRQRIILFIAIAIVVAVLSIVGVGVYKGWYVEDYKPLHETVLEVNGTEFDMEYYTDMLTYYTQGLPVDYVSFLTDSVLEIIERNELVLQAATALGITVDDKEVKELMESQDPPLDKKYRDIAVTQLLGQKLLDEYFEEQVPQTADQRHIMAMFLESETRADEVTARIEAGESFSDIAAELSLDDTTKEAEGDLGWCPLGILPLTVDSLVLEDSAFDLEVGVLSPPIAETAKTRKLGYWLIEVISVDFEAEPVEAQTRVILVENEQLANDIIDRLDAGEKFADLAAEFSRHTVSSEEGGDFTVSPDAMTTAFDAYVFDPEVELGVLSPPIADDEITLDGGYWLIQVVEAEAGRQIDEENRDLLKSNALNQWIESLMEDPENNIVNSLDDEKKSWAVLYVIGG